MLLFHFKMSSFVWLLSVSELVLVFRQLKHGLMCHTAADIFESHMISRECGNLSVSNGSGATCGRDSTNQQQRQEVEPKRAEPHEAHVLNTALYFTHALFKF